jgi:phosphoglycerate dehydrogenase-like enzyme
MPRTGRRSTYVLLNAPSQAADLTRAMIVMRVGKLPESQLNESAAPRLRIIARNGTGVDMIHKETCLKRGIAVTNQPGGNAKAVAEVGNARIDHPIHS